MPKRFCVVLVVSLLLLQSAGQGAPQPQAEPEYARLWRLQKWASPNAESLVELQIALVAGQDDAVAFLRNQLHQPVDRQRFQNLLEQLGDRDFRVRQRTVQHMVEMGVAIRGVVVDALESARDPEVKARLELVRKELAGGQAWQEHLIQAQVACMVLGEIATPAARELLTDLQGYWDGPSARLAAIKLSSLLAQQYEQALKRQLAAILDGQADLASQAGTEARKLLKDQKLGPDDEALVLRVSETQRERARKLAEALAAGQSGTQLALEIWAYLHLPAKAVAHLPADSDDPRIQAARKWIRSGREKKLDRDTYLKTAQLLLAMEDESEPVLVILRHLAVSEIISGARDSGALGQADQNNPLMALSQASQAKAIAARARLTGWRDLLGGVDLKQTVRAGDWTAGDRGWSLAKGDFGLVELPGKLKADYTLRISLVRTEGKDGIYIAFPVGKASLNLNLSGWEGKATGLEWIGGQEAISGPAKVMPGALANNVSHRVQIEVDVDGDAAEVKVSLDGNEILSYKGQQDQMEAAKHAWARKEMSAVALGAHQSAVLFQSVIVDQPEPPAREPAQADGSDDQ